MSTVLTIVLKFLKGLSFKDWILLAIAVIATWFAFRSYVQNKTLQAQMAAQASRDTQQLIDITKQRDHWKVVVANRDQTVYQMSELLMKKDSISKALAGDLMRANAKISTLTDANISLKGQVDSVKGQLFHADSSKSALPDSAKFHGTDGPLNLQVTYRFPPVNLFSFQWSIPKLPLTWVEATAPNGQCLLFVRSSDPRVQIDVPNHSCAKPSSSSNQHVRRWKDWLEGGVAALVIREGIKLLILH